MGSSTLYQLACRGVKALGIDLLCPPHTSGSTHGETRITRQALGEGDHYTPLSLRSLEIFRELESKTNSKLLEVTGGLIISSASSSVFHVPGFFENTVAAARKYGIRHEILTVGEMRTRFPQFNLDDDEIGYYEFEMGILRPEEAVRVQLSLAQELGATIHTNETVRHFEETPNAVTVQTDKSTYEAQHLVLSVGPWLPQLLPQVESTFQVCREVLYWFDISQSFSDFQLGKFPIFIWLIKGSESGLYGFPALDGALGGLKISTSDYTTAVTQDSVERTVSAEETASMFKNKVAPFISKVGAKCIKSAVCLYTVTADSGFVIDWLPSSKRILLCSPCSGHGFKHSPAIGESIAQLITSGETSLDMSAFKLDRLLGKSLI